MATTKNEDFLGRCQTMKSAYGSFKKVSFGPDDLKKMNEWAKDNKGWVNILIKTKKTTSPDQSDFYVSLDTWKPDGGNYRDKMPF